MRRTISLLALILVVLGCKKESRDVTATSAEPASQTTASEAPPHDVAEHSVEPYSRADVGALEVKSIDADPADWFEVHQNGKRAYDANPPLLNTSIELAPGAYTVDVNRVKREITIEAGKKTILWTGNLVVEGEPSSAFWYPNQGKDRRLSSNPPLFNKPRALFPGTYTVYAYVSVTTGDELLGDAEVKPGQTTVVKK